MLQSLFIKYTMPRLAPTPPGFFLTLAKAEPPTGESRLGGDETADS